MAALTRLSILGIRSFDNTRSEAIQFRPPLTLIVGTNGSGKTTIIECLKFVTTGQLPPGTANSAFIHDPKLCGEKEVLGQIKLAFFSTEGAKMVCTRSMQVTVKKGAAGYTYKALDNNILMSKDGQKITMSSRVAELDSQIPAYLGVSKAVIDSVIFCHQEESLWPLAEPKKLKERFDKIFDALKYTKVIDTMKVLQKNKKQDLIGFKKDEEHMKWIKDKATQNQKRSEDLLNEIEDLREKSEKKGEAMKEAARKSQDAWNKCETAAVVVAELDGKRIQKQTKQESVQSLEQTLKEMTDSDEELQRMLEQYDERVQAYRDDLERQKVQYSDLNENVKEARKQVGVKERECGLYEAQKEAHERQVERRVDLVNENARSYNIRGFDMDVDDAQVEAFIERISKMARDQNAEFERARRETSEELQRAQQVLNQINERKTTFNQRKESARETTSANDRKMASIQNDLNKINVDEGRKAAMESNLRETEAKLEGAKSEIGNANWDSNIETAEAELRKADDRKERLDAELVEGTRRAGDSAQLDYVQKELKNRERSLETMTGAHGEKITSIVGGSWTPATIDADFQRSLGQASSHLAEAEKQRNGISHEMEQIEFQLKKCREDLKSKQDALQKAEKAVYSAAGCAPADYPEEVKALEASRDTAKEDADASSRLLAFFEHSIKTATDHNGCRMCNRAFGNQKELDKTLEIIDREKKKLQKSIDEGKQDLMDLEKELQAARAVSSDFDTWERLKKKEIPTVEKDEKQHAEKREKLIRQLEDQDAIVSERESVKRDIEALMKTVQTIAKYHADIESFKKQIKDLIAKQQAAGSTRGLEAIQEDVKKINDEMKSIKSRLTNSVSARDRSRTQINSLELEYRDIKSNLSSAEHQLKEKQALERQIEELKGSNNQQRELQKSIDQELQGLVPQLSQAEAKYDDINERGKEKDRKLHNEINKLNNSVSELKKADQDVKAYKDRGGERQLKDCRLAVTNLQNEVTRVEAEMSQVVRDVKSLEEQLRNHDETKRNIADNQRYRRDARQLEAVTEEIKQLESRNAEEDKARYEREGRHWQLERNKLAGEQATMIGSLKTMDNQLDQLHKEFKVDYQDAGMKLTDANIHVETTKAVIEDLGCYAGALDKAIMKYHSHKMQEINRTIEELWRATYQGTDVDTILIRSESEGGKTNKSYNYRVVMVKQDAEMDMRGRCSAGQKVLASIIIRLALAETFGINCGVIALDEPTTNLDSENIEALAKSLSAIIRNRMNQKNFHLIIITHDEEFLRAMQCSEFTEECWRVSRNAKQKSIIEKNSISVVS